MNDYHIRTTCRLCNGTLSEPLFDLGETALANELSDNACRKQETFPLYLVQCRDCAHVQLPVVVKAERLFPPSYPYRSSTSPVMREHLDRLAANVEMRLRGNAPLGGNVLEIGSNDGYLLKQLESKGLFALGVDPSASGDALAIRAPFNSRLATWLQADAVVAVNVLAHIDDLTDVYDGIEWVLCASDGTLVVEVGYWPDVLRNGDVGVIYHEHMSYHHLTPLLGFCDEIGLPVTDVEHIDTQGGSIRVWCGSGAVGQSVADMVTEEAAMDLSPRRLVASTELLKRKLVDAVEGMRVVAAYGASAKLTSFCAATGWHPSGLIYDDNDAKMGKFTANGNAIVAATCLGTYDHPDALVVTSYNFASEIVPRVRQTGYKGRIIVPLPIDKFEVLNA